MSCPCKYENGKKVNKYESVKNKSFKYGTLYYLTKLLQLSGQMLVKIFICIMLILATPLIVLFVLLSYLFTGKVTIKKPKVINF